MGEGKPAPLSLTALHGLSPRGVLNTLTLPASKTSPGSEIPNSITRCGESVPCVLNPLSRRFVCIPPGSRGTGGSELLRHRLILNTSAVIPVNHLFPKLKACLIARCRDNPVSEPPVFCSPAYRLPLQRHGRHRLQDLNCQLPKIYFKNWYFAGLHATFPNTAFAFVSTTS